MSPGLPVVFVHGIRLSGTMWHPVMERIGRDHPTAAPDLPGHGRRRGEIFTAEGAVDAVAAAIDELGGRALVVGLSLGGYVAQAVAGRDPQRVAGLVAFGSTAVAGGVWGGVYHLLAGVAARHAETGNRLSAWGFRRALPAHVAEAVVAGGMSCEVMQQAVDAVMEMDPPAALARYPGPVWLVNGARDPFRADERAFLRACRDGRLISLPRRGHVTTLAEPARLARIVQDAAIVAAASEQ
jgi:pimeloyl-ACP methyl ester carboxylesterase